MQCVIFVTMVYIYIYFYLLIEILKLHGFISIYNMVNKYLIIWRNYLIFKVNI